MTFRPHLHESQVQSDRQLRSTLTYEGVLDNDNIQLHRQQYDIFKFTFTFERPDNSREKREEANAEKSYSQTYATTVPREAQGIRSPRV